jgi:hypothetical protein
VVALAVFGPVVAAKVLKRTRAWWIPGAAAIASAIAWLAVPHEGRRTTGEAGPDVGLLIEYAFVIAIGVVWLVVLAVSAIQRASRRPSR